MDKNVFTIGNRKNDTICIINKIGEPYGKSLYGEISVVDKAVTLKMNVSCYISFVKKSLKNGMKFCYCGEYFLVNI